MSEATYTVTFKTQGGGDYKVSAALGDNLLDIAQKAGVAIDAPCNGNGTCGKCYGHLISGTVDVIDSIRISEENFEDGWRLLCRCTVCGDVAFWVPMSAADYQKGIQTADLSTLEQLIHFQEALVRVFDTSLSYGRAEEGLGIAVDIGTTTVTAALIDLDSGLIKAKASGGNGQIRYGADVINRIIAQSRPGGVEKLRHAVVEETLFPLVEELCSQVTASAPATAPTATAVPATAQPSDIRCAVIAGNTTMEHLFVGADAQSIRLEPFEPEFLELPGKTSADLGLPFAPDAPVIFAPNVGSYVGGDITAGALDSLIWNTDKMTLFIDLGTNGELVFGNRDFMLCCACSAGPAFEGGEISWGMRATGGAISAVRIDPDTMEPSLTVIGDGAPLGICGSGIIDAVAELFSCGIIDARGTFIREGARIRRDEGTPCYILAFADESANKSDIFLNETDINNFIRAKGAIFSAIRSMLNSLDMTVDVIDQVIVAGGIGNGINIGNAISIGMLPRISVSKYRYIGNSSLTGACAMLLSQDATDQVFRIGRNMTYIELSTHPGYMDEFVAACFLPHTDATLFE